MAGAGDIVTNLALNNGGFKKSADESVGSMRSIKMATEDAAQQLDVFSQRAVIVGTATGIAATGMTSVASAAGLVGGTVPGLNAAAIAVRTISTVSTSAGVGVGALANSLFGIDRTRSPLSQVSQLIGKIGSMAVAAKIGAMGIGAALRLVGKDSSRFDKWSSQLGLVALRATQVRIAIFGISTAAKVTSAAVMLPFRSMTMGLQAVKSMAEGAARATVGVGKGIASTIASVAAAGGGAGGAALAALAGPALAAFGAMKSIGLAASLERDTIAFETMLGSAEKAQSFLKGLQAFAAATPFEFTELVDASRRLMALGFDAENVVPVLRTVGDATAALGLGSQGIDRITLALGQMRSKGKVSAQEINQLAEAGIPAWEMIAKRIGVSIPEAMKMAENGAISAGTGINAVLEGMSSRFGGGMEKQSKTVLGLWSTMRDNIGFIMTDIGGALVEGFNLKGLLGESNDFLAQFRATWMPGITSAINTVGLGFQRLIDGLRNGWGQWIADSLAGVADFVANFDIYLKTGWAIASAGFQTFTTWMQQSWSALLDGMYATLAEFATKSTSALTNIATGVATGGISGGISATIKQAMGDATNSKAFDKFARKVTSLPGMVATAVGETNPEIAKLYNELARRQEEARARAAQETASAGEAAFKPISEDLMSGNDKSKSAKGAAQTSAAALQAGSRDAGSAIAKAFNNTRSPQIKLQEQQLKESREHTRLLRDMAGGQTQILPAMI